MNTGSDPMDLHYMEIENVKQIRNEIFYRCQGANIGQLLVEIRWTDDYFATALHDCFDIRGIWTVR